MTHITATLHPVGKACADRIVTEALNPPPMVSCSVAVVSDGMVRPPIVLAYLNRPVLHYHQFSADVYCKTIAHKSPLAQSVVDMACMVHYRWHYARRTRLQFVSISLQCTSVQYHTFPSVMFIYLNVNFAIWAAGMRFSMFTGPLNCTYMRSRYFLLLDNVLLNYAGQWCNTYGTWRLV